MPWKAWDRHLGSAEGVEGLTGSVRRGREGDSLIGREEERDVHSTENLRFPASPTCKSVLSSEGGSKRSEAKRNRSVERSGSSWLSHLSSLVFHLFSPISHLSFLIYSLLSSPPYAHTHHSTTSGRPPLALPRHGALQVDLRHCQTGHGLLCY